MFAAFAFLSAGILLGLSGGLSPGPLLALVIRETLRGGVRAGIGIALAPLLTDAPIILATMLLLQPLTGQNVALALIHVGGGLYLAWLGVQSLCFTGAELGPFDPSGAISLRRGVIATVLNPSPYLFWLAVGGPTLLAAWRESGLAAAAFIGAFYALLIGSKVLLAVIVGHVRSVLHSGGYVMLMRGLGLLLLAYALLLFHEGGRLWQG